MRFILIFLFAVAQLSAFSCTSPEASNTGEIPAGRPAGTCTSIVSLAPSITETLFALGLGDSVTGVTRYCVFPAEARQKPSVGGYMDPSLEAIVSLRPSLVMLLAEHGALIDRLDELGIQTLVLRNNGVAAIYDSIARIGRTCGVDENAAALRSVLADRTAQAAERTRGLPKVRTLITLGRNMGSGGIRDVFVAGRQIFYDDLIRMAGGENAYQGNVPVPLVSKEGLISLNPAVIVDMVPRLEDRNGVSAATAAADWRGLPLDAVRQGRVYVFEAPYAVIPGPRFVETLMDLTRMIHPEVGVP